jgi:20S proteasome alpha/beta subunit
MQWVNGLEEKLGLPYSMIDIDPSGKYLDDSLIALGEALSKIYKELDAYI